MHIPKCAGVSVSTSLFGVNAGGHETLGDYTLIYDRNEFNSFYKFTFVRNPWSRLVSAYRFLKKGGTEAGDRRWADKNLSRYSDFESFVAGFLNPANIETYVHFVPQYKFLCLGGTTPRVGFIGRFENLSADFVELSGRLGKQAELAFLNKTPGDSVSYKDYYSNRTRDIVAKVYRRDIELFDYSFEDG